MGWQDDGDMVKSILGYFFNMTEAQAKNANKGLNALKLFVMQLYVIRQDVP